MDVHAYMQNTQCTHAYEQAHWHAHIKQTGMIARRAHARIFVILMANGGLASCMQHFTGMPPGLNTLALLAGRLPGLNTVLGSQP